MYYMNTALLYTNNTRYVIISYIGGVVMSRIEQRKYYNRENFTSAERDDICLKSCNRCSHCGKPIFAGYQMTVDHFIPLDKGGSNNFINLIPLCEDCNNSKDNKIYSTDYIPYLLPKYKKQIQEYLDSYLQVTDYVQRHRLLAYDEYTRTVPIPAPIQMSKMYNKKANKLPELRKSYIIKHATWNDLNKLTDYFVKYLEKYNNLDSIEAAKQNIIFWLQFGCIYYVEINNEITIMFAITIKHESTDFRGLSNLPHMFIFPYYQTTLANQIFIDTCYRIPKLICLENNLDYIPINLVLLKEDKNQYHLLSLFHAEGIQYDIEGFTLYRLFISADDSERYMINEPTSVENMTEAEQKTYEFFNSFSDITNDLISYFNKYPDTATIGWMITCILSVDLIKEYNLDKYMLIE